MPASLMEGIQTRRHILPPLGERLKGEKKPAGLMEGIQTQWHILPSLGEKLRVRRSQPV